MNNNSKEKQVYSLLYKIEPQEDINMFLTHIKLHPKVLISLPAVREILEEARN